jgi:WD40 repeat protein
VSGSDDGSAVLWDVRAKRPLAEFAGAQRSKIYSMALTPDGKTLLAGCGDGTIKRWKVPFLQSLEAR